jgi:uncharacterized protein (DUF58 family)
VNTPSVPAVRIVLTRRQQQRLLEYLARTPLRGGEASEFLTIIQQIQRSTTHEPTTD